MKIKILILFVSAFFIVILSASAPEELFLFGASEDQYVGTIEKMGLNSISLRDEHDKRIKKFVYVGNRAKLHIGDRVRIYIQRKTGQIESIQKMTPVEYEKNSVNRGFFLKAKDK